jgi:hypothetical protein
MSPGYLQENGKKFTSPYLNQNWIWWRMPVITAVPGNVKKRIMFQVGLDKS